MAGESFRSDILFRSLPGAIARQLPANVAALGFQGFVAAIDVLYIAFLGTTSLAAVALVFPCLALMRTIAATGLGTATSSLVAAAVGKGDAVAANRAFIYGLLLTLIYSACWSALFLTVGDRLYSYFGGTGEHLELANEYSRAVFAGAVLSCLAQLLLGTLRGLGGAVSASLIAIAGGVTQIVVTPVLMFGALGTQPLGIAGAGLGFVAASLPVVIVAPLLIWRLMPSLKSVTHARIPIDAPLLVRFLSIAGPTSLNSALNYLVLLVVSGIVATLGPDSLAAFGVVTRLEYFGFLMIFGAGATTVTFVAMNFGAGRVERAHHAMWGITLVTAGLMSICCIAMAINPSPVTQIFSSEDSVREVAGYYMRSGLAGFPFLAAGLILYYASIGLSRPAFPFFNNVVRCSVMVALVWLSVHRLEAGLYGIGFSIGASSVVYFGLMFAWSRLPSTWRLPQAV
jgi:putative MATE family efflux protein